MHKIEQLMDWKEFGNGYLVINTDYQVIFDKSTGLAIFENLQINKPGMYVLAMNVSTNDNEYQSICYSNSIKILASSSKVINQIYDSNVTPEYIARFDGDFNSIIPAEIEAIMYNYISSYGINMAGISCWPYLNQVYISFYSKDFRSLLMQNIVSNGLNISHNLNFVSISFENQNFTCLNCSKIIPINEIENLMPTYAIVLIAVAIGIFVGFFIGFSTIKYLSFIKSNIFLLNILLNNFLIYYNFKKNTIK